MKKTIFNLLVIMAFAGSAYAASQNIPSTGTSIGSQAFRPSNAVTITVSSKSGISTDPGGFSVTSSHGSGNREFATNHAESKIYWQEKGTATTVTCTGASAYAPTFGSGWTSL